jgi:hypothetical protein
MTSQVRSAGREFRSKRGPVPASVILSTGLALPADRVGARLQLSGVVEDQYRTRVELLPQRIEMLMIRRS